MKSSQEKIMICVYFDNPHENVSIGESGIEFELVNCR